MPEQHSPESRKTVNRRAFMGVGALATAATLVPGRLDGAGAAPRPVERVLSFFNTHTGERLHAAYCCGGVYQRETLAKIDHILRDFRNDEVKPIDTGLLDLLYELRGTLHTDQPLHVISGYRSPGTNAMLHSRGGASTGVATGSLHMVGKAIDIRVPDVRLEKLHAAARALKLGGVGYYPESDFVHVDTGRVRYW